MSFALAHQSNKNKAGDGKIFTSAKHPTIYHHMNNLDSTNYIFHLQRTIGNQAVQRLMRSNTRFSFANISINDNNIVQRKPSICSCDGGCPRCSIEKTIENNRSGDPIIQLKLKISQPGDAYEQEADRIAEQVMKMSVSDLSSPMKTTKVEGADRRCSTCEIKEIEEGHEKVKIGRKISDADNIEGTENIISEINNIRSSGSSSPLEANTKEFMESRFGFDFSSVRMHTDERAVQSAHLVDALAYTVGNDIVFEEGQYEPNTIEGRRLLAHELVHVLQQSDSTKITAEHIARGTIIQRKNGKPKDKKGERERLTRLYEHRSHGFLITKYSLKGIDFLVGVPQPTISNIEDNLDGIAAAIAGGNKWITDDELKVRTCIIAPTTTRFATFKEKPVLALDPPDATKETVVHEMGHAIFAHYRTTAGQPKSPTKDLALEISDIYLQLSDTKPVKDNERDSMGNLKEEERPAGLWIADPSQWSKNLATEHPWDNAEEMFASARKAYLIDRNGLKGSIKKFAKLDPKVKKPAEELLLILSHLAAGKVPKALKIISRKEAEQHMTILPETTKIESTLGSRAREVLRWTVDPSTIPTPQPVAPELKAP